MRRALLRALLAYLTDRVRTAQGKRQIYGTQFKEVNGTLQPEPIEDPGHVDARRASIGLNSLDEYRAQVAQTCGKPPREALEPLWNKQLK